MIKESQINWTWHSHTKASTTQMQLPWYHPHIMQNYLGSKMEEAAYGLNCKVGSFPFKYLSLPIGVNPTKIIYRFQMWRLLEVDLHHGRVGIYLLEVDLFSWRQYFLLSLLISFLSSKLPRVSLILLSFTLRSLFGVRRKVQKFISY